MTEPQVRKDDWVTQVLDRLDAFIELVRDNTTGRLAKVARYAVYLMLFVVVGAAFVALLIILLFRTLSYLPGPMWTVYAGGAVVFLLTGRIFWRKAIRATR